MLLPFASIPLNAVPLTSPRRCVPELRMRHDTRLRQPYSLSQRRASGAVVGTAPLTIAITAAALGRRGLDAETDIPTGREAQGVASPNGARRELHNVRVGLSMP